MAIPTTKRDRRVARESAMSHQALLAELYARAPRGMRLGVEAMQAACDRFDNPERAFAAVHVAGTNGKGSVCAMLEAAARAAGRRTGLYSSPHLSRFAERIRVNGEPLDDDRLGRTLGEVLRREPELSFFEAATLTAFVAFREAKVDLAIVEVGLGGRLDATNVLPKPLATAVTRIAFDHMDKLGSTLVEIAREKGAIAKAGAPMLVGRVDQDVFQAIEMTSRSRGATARSIVDEPSAVAFARGARLSLAGEHQRDNAALAFALAQTLGIDDATAAGAIEGARWPGRLERLETERGPVLLDAAHNPDGARALAAALADARPENTALVFGALADKDAASMLDILAPLARVRAYAPARGRLATPTALLAARHNGATCATVMEALGHARSAVDQGGLVVVAGSISLVGEVRASLLGEPMDEPVAL